MCQKVITFVTSAMAFVTPLRYAWFVITTATIPLWRHPERWLFTGFVALVLAPVLVQGLDRPLAHVLGGAPAGISATYGALVVAFAAWFVCAIRKEVQPHVVGILVGLVAAVTSLALQVRVVGLFELMVVAAGSFALAWWLPSRLPAVFDGLAPRYRVLTAVYVLLAVVSIVQVTRVSVFMGDPTRTDAQVVPGMKFVETHSCLTAYVRATEYAHDRVDNLYLAERWPSTLEAVDPPKTPFSPFGIDEFFYPPPFLLFAEPLMPLRGDFLAQRAAWFGLNGLVFAAAFWMGARYLGGTRWHRPLLLAPIFFGSFPVLLTLQIGNAQGIVVVASILAMLAFDMNRPALGGFSLAFATLAKLSPGVLGLILLAQMRWRAIAWTAAFGVILLLVAVFAYGTNPIESWLTYALPRLSSGEAFSSMLHHPPSIAANLAPAGIPFKLTLLGVHLDDPWLLSRRINVVFTLVIAALAIAFGRRHMASDVQTRAPRALAWMSLLYLGALRSPFAPGYVTFALMWLVTLQSVEVETRRGAVALFALFLAIVVVPPMPPEQLALYVLLVMPIGPTVAAWLLLRRKTQALAPT